MSAQRKRRTRKGRVVIPQQQFQYAVVKDPFDDSFYSEAAHSAAINDIKETARDLVDEYIPGIIKEKADLDKELQKIGQKMYEKTSDKSRLEKEAAALTKGINEDLAKMKTGSGRKGGSDKAAAEAAQEKLRKLYKTAFENSNEYVPLPTNQQDKNRFQALLDKAQQRITKRTAGYEKALSKLQADADKKGTEYAKLETRSKKLEKIIK